MNPHRGLLHHLIITVADVRRSSAFYGPVLRYLGYELADHHYGPDHAYEDWKPWRLDTPHEISIGQANPDLAGVPHVKGAVGHHHHLAFCAGDRADVDRFHAEVLVPLAAQGLATIEDPPCDCPEYGEGYYATFFLDPDGLKYEFVVNPNYLRKKAARDLAHQPPSPMEAPPPLAARRDREHLRLLAVFHFVFAGLSLLGIGFLALHYGLMHAFFANPDMWKQAQGTPPPELFAAFKWFYLVFGAICLAGFLLNLLSGLGLRRQRSRLFSIVVAGLDCLQIPFGTVLGVFTIFVLMRPSVQGAYSDAKTP